MKFCPVCASKLDGKLECSCGFKTTQEELDKRIEEIKEKGPQFYFTEPVINNNLMEEKKNKMTLEELLKEETTNDEINSLSYSGGGGMLGGHFSINLYFDTKELVYVNQDFHYSPTITKKYKVNDDLINNIKDYIKKYNLPAWSKIRENISFRMTDVGITHLFLRYPKKTYSMSFIIDLDKDEEKIFFDFRDLVYSCMDEDNLISTEEQKGKELNLNMMTCSKEKEELIIPNFCPNCGSKFNENQTKCSCGYKVN